jgi:16S rRNA G527 N7-methylase RsmG
VNLTGARSPAERVAALVAPVLPLLPWVEGGPLVDVGSGNGSPGLVLALLRPDLAVTLLEPRARRWAFLRDAARTVGRADLAVLRLRHDAYRGPPARTVTVRALSLPLAELGGILEKDGRVIVLGRAPRPAPDFRVETGPGSAGLHVYRHQCST